MMARVVEALLGYVDVAQGDAAAGIDRIEAAIRRAVPATLPLASSRPCTGCSSAPTTWRGMPRAYWLPPTALWLSAELGCGSPRFGAYGAARRTR